MVTVLAAAYFLYLAIRIAAVPPLSAETEARRRPSFAGGVFLSLVNPKAYAAMAALFSGFALVPGRLALDAAAKMAVLTAIITTVNLAFAALLLASVAAALLL